MVFGAQPAEATAHEVRFLARVLAAPDMGPVLDVCCGSGRHLAGLATLGYDVVGIEREPAVAAAARAAVPQAWILEGDMQRVIPEIDDSFAGVVCLWQSFGYGTAAENATLLAAMAQLLEPGRGRLVLDVHNRTFFETRTGERQLERGGRSVREETRLDGNRLTTTLDYGRGVEDVFSWQLFTPEELVELARSSSLVPVHLCTGFDERVAPSPDEARMQIVCKRDT